MMNSILPRTLLRTVATSTTTTSRLAVMRPLATSMTMTRRTLATDETSRPFQVLGVQQIAIGSVDKAALTHLWVDLLGCGPIQSSHRLEGENVDEDILALDGVEVDLMAPIDAEKKPAVHNPPLNHIGLWVDDLPTAVDWLTAQGMRFTPGGIRTGAAGYDVVFIHPKAKPDAGLPYSGQGVLIELVQAPDDVIAAKKK